MAKLTEEEAQELATFFNAHGGVIGRGLRAQSYEPGGGSYDPYRDTSLVTLVFEASRRANSVENFVWRVLSLLEELSGGVRLVEILRCAVEKTEVSPLTKEFGTPSLVRLASTALDRGRRHAEREEHRRLLEVTYDAARTRGASGPTTAMRVLETDAHLLRSGVSLAPWQLVNGSFAAVELALTKPRDEEFLFSVRREIKQMLHGAVEAYRTTRATVVAARSAKRQEAQRAREDFLSDLLAKKRRRETAKFERKLSAARRAS